MARIIMHKKLISIRYHSFIQNNYCWENSIFIPKDIDLSNIEHLKYTTDLANRYINSFNRSELIGLERFLSKNKTNHPLLVQLAIKLAISKTTLSSIQDKMYISVVFAMYHEHNRIQSPSTHPNGEDFLRRKIEQLDWLFEGTAHEWNLVAVDDGCDKGSGNIAKQILSEIGLPEDKANVIFLKDAIQQKFPIAYGLSSVKDSQKGGAIAYGLWYSILKEQKNHIVIFTDADLSTHLGQIGLLVDGIVNGNNNATIGSRALDTSVKKQTGSRHYRGKLFSYLQKKINVAISYIIDTQCGFKAFTADSLKTILKEKRLENKFAFDSELLILLEQKYQSKSIAEVAIAWVDSDSESTTSSLKPYLPMLKSMTKMYRKYLPQDRITDTFAELIENMKEEEWEMLLANIPDSIKDIEDSKISDFIDITAQELKNRSSQ